MHNQDHIAAIPQERFQGAVPAWLGALQVATLLGLSPIGYRKDGSPILPMAGGAQMTMADLEQFRSISEYETYQENVKARTKEIDAQFAGQPFPEEVRAEWAELGELDKEIDARLVELRARSNRITELASDERHVEHTEQPPRRESTRSSYLGGGNGRTAPRPSHVPDDIFAIEQYRSLSTTQEQQNQALIDGALMAIDRADFPHERAEADSTRADLHRLFGRIDDPVALARHVLATGQPVYQRAVIKGAAGRPLFADEERMLQGNVRAQTLSVDTAGGFAVPFQLDPTLILTSDGAINPIRQIARVERITGKKWQGLTTAGVTAAYTATEGDEAPATDLVVAQPEVEVVEASAFVEFSIALELSWGALQAELARVIQDAKDTLEAEKFIQGSGTGEPHGIVSTLSPSSNVFVGGTFDVEDLYNMTGSGTNPLPPRFRPRASWIADLSIYNRIRGFSVGSVGEGAIWVRGIATDRPDALLGKNAYEASGMDNSLAAGNDIMVLGDFRYFLVADRIGLTIEVVQHTFGASRRPKTSRGALAYWMNNTLILADNAFRKLRTGTGS